MVCSAGVGFKPEYFEQAITSPEAGLWFEVHTENYLVDGGPRLDQLEQLRSRSPLSLHGVSASLGSGKPINAEFLSRLKSLVDRFQPRLVSEHATWCRNDLGYIPDLLPLPRTREMMAQLIDGVCAYQEGIGRQILLENPTNYLDFICEIDEPEFLVEVANRSGCGLLLDVNNLYLSSVNCGVNAQAYIDALPADKIGEIHVAGFSVDPRFGDQLLIDSHAEPISEPVWALLDYVQRTKGAIPVIVERDDQLPQWDELMIERNRAQSMVASGCRENVVS